MGECRSECIGVEEEKEGGVGSLSSLISAMVGTIDPGNLAGHPPATPSPFSWSNILQVRCRFTEAYSVIKLEGGGGAKPT